MPPLPAATDRVQAFEVTVVANAFLVYASSVEVVEGCPTCVRKRLWAIFLMSLPMANVFFPFVAPVLLWQIGESRRKDRPGIPPQYLVWSAIPPSAAPRAGPARIKVGPLLLGLFLLLCVIAFVLVVMPRLAG